ncbi:hypothetical protein EI94DRAFT_1704846 [Lactarius quietus]|nr:hypothetical protein EI94DRAFT_1704846 [Lactarius quietus]
MPHASNVRSNRPRFGSVVTLTLRATSVYTASISPESGKAFHEVKSLISTFLITRHRLLSMSQSPAPGSSPKPPISTASSSHFESIFNKALKQYKNKTKQKITAHPLAEQLENATLRRRFRPYFKTSDERLQRWLVPTINVLQAFSETLGEGISLVFSPAKMISSVLVSFFRRLEVYTKVPPTPAMANMMVKIMVEVLDILGTATKEMKQSRTKKIIKKIAGVTRLDDGLKMLDKMTNEEARMANAEAMRLAYDIDKKVDRVDEKCEPLARK